MQKPLLFIPDISGFTNFVQSTEIDHSRHVIAELLEVLIDANDIGLTLAEIEGDALFFYKDKNVPNKEELLGLTERMYTAFYNHLKQLETNRICSCSACASATGLKLKMVAHSGDFDFITVKDSRKPFGKSVIETHRLLKNSVDSDNYILFSDPIGIDDENTYGFGKEGIAFVSGSDKYDGQEIGYKYAIVDAKNLPLEIFKKAEPIKFDREADIAIEKTFPTDLENLRELITNYRFRHLWTLGVDKITYDQNEVTRLGTEHACTIGQKELNFVVVTLDAEEDGQKVYGEYTTDAPFLKELYQFFHFKRKGPYETQLKLELFYKPKNLLGGLIFNLIGKSKFTMNINRSLNSLHEISKAPDKEALLS